MAKNPAYVVRGAKMMCVIGKAMCGSHKRKINLPVSHGSYVNEKPMMNEDDYKSKNVKWFGVCKKCTEGEDIYLVGEDGKTVVGKKCKPKILKKWTKTKKDTKVDGKAALTTDSILVCKHGGHIMFYSDGQEKSNK